MAQISEGEDQALWKTDHDYEMQWYQGVFLGPGHTEQERRDVDFAITNGKIWQMKRAKINAERARDNIPFYDSKQIKAQMYKFPEESEERMRWQVAQFYRDKEEKRRRDAIELQEQIAIMDANGERTSSIDRYAAARKRKEPEPDRNIRFRDIEQNKRPHKYEHPSKKSRVA